ncbi:MAG: hypothetical protein IJJ41_02640 [Clostridia bacterium]|nr:hypothetical protein [Clostridia bacterium]
MKKNKNKNKRSVSTNFNDPQKGFDSTSKRIVFSLLIVIVVVMLGTYVYIDYKYGSFTNMFIGETTETTTEEPSEKIEIKEMEGKRNLLIAVTSPGESELYNVFMVGINMTERKSTLISVPLQTKDSGGKTLQEEFKLGGVTQIEYSLERLFDIDFDRYFCATQNGYKFLLTEFGKTVQVDIAQDLQFSTTNYTVSLKAGKQDLPFDTFVKLLLFDEWQGGKEATYTMQAQLLKSLYEQYCKQKYVTRDPDKFTYKMTYIDSNFSSEDYVNELDAIEFIAATDFKLAVLTPQGSFSGSGDKEIFTFSKKGIAAIHSAFTLAPVQE